jgi:hypothetical protein
LISGVSPKKPVAASRFDSINLLCIIIAASPFGRELVGVLLLEVFQDGKAARKFQSPQLRTEQSPGEADKDRKRFRDP